MRDERLDAMRGIAAFAVAISHIAALYFTPFLDDAGTDLQRFIFSFGAPAVDFFFVLSGYVLTKSIQRYTAQAQPQILWVMGRWVRLLPLAWVGVLLGLLVRELPLTLPETAGSLGKHMSLPLQAGSVGQWLFTWPIPDTSRYNASLWTIYPEMHAAILLPPAIAIAIRYPRAFLPGAFLLAVIFAFAGNTSYPLIFPPFAVGIALALNEHRFSNKSTIAGCLLGLTILLCRSWTASESAFLHLLAPIGAAILILAARDAGPRGICNSPVLIGFGACSYAFYIAHYPVMIAFAGYFTPNLPLWLSATISLPATFLLSKYLTRVIDLRAARLGRDVAYAGLPRKAKG